MEKDFRFVNVSLGTYLPYSHSSHKSLTNYHMLYSGRWQFKEEVGCPTDSEVLAPSWLMPCYKFGIPRLSQIFRGGLVQCRAVVRRILVIRVV